MARTFRVGTRGTPLALRQAEWVVERLRAAGASTALEVLDTQGDRRPDIPMWRFDDSNPFTSDLDAALLKRRIDLAVHSLKDLPYVLQSGLGLVAVGERADPREVLVSRGWGRGRLEDLPPEAIVATSSRRRRAQLLHLRPDLRVVDLRGAIGARLAALDATPGWSAILIAAAGLERLGLSSLAGEFFSVDRLVPAPGQGAIGITCRLRDLVAASTARRAVEHPAVRVAISAERALVERLDTISGFAGAAHASIQSRPGGWSIGLVACLVAIDGSARFDARIDGEIVSLSGALDVGASLAARLAAQAGAMELR